MRSMIATDTDTIPKSEDVDVNYVMYGKKDADTICYLHGWGQNIQMMQPVGDPFDEEFNIEFKFVERQN